MGTRFMSSLVREEFKANKNWTRPNNADEKPFFARSVEQYAYW